MTNTNLNLELKEKKLLKSLAFKRAKIFNIKEASKDSTILYDCAKLLTIEIKLQLHLKFYEIANAIFISKARMAAKVQMLIKDLLGSL